MGFLEVGTPLSWSDSAAVRDYVKQHGIKQLLHLWKTNRDRKDFALRWGEEVEYSLVDINNEQSETRVYCGAAVLLEELVVREHIRPRPTTQLASEWHPEFSNHMIEAIPSPPYTLNINSLLMLEPSMRLRRAKIQSILPANTFVTSQTVFPRFGVGDFVRPSVADVSPDDSVTHSVFIPDELLNPHPRFPTLVANIRSRRGANPFIKIPVYKDINTGAPCGGSPESDWSLAKPVDRIDRFEAEILARRTLNPVKDHIYMDCFAFGMGMSCVQTTFACPDISVARYLYDQLAVLAPLFLALTASTPFQRGLLSDYDTRWSTLEQAVDCRTEEEMLTLPKSRYSGVSKYISDRQPLIDHLDDYNDTLAPVNDDVVKTLRDAGMDSILANHFGHLWIRDPMIIFSEKVELDDTTAVDHFENIQSTNWNSIRFKPPPPSQHKDKLHPIGWRVEFRTPEIQLTDVDNAAGVALISVLTQMILAQDLDLYIPMSLNDVNMTRSWRRDAIINEKFFFRRNITKGATDRTTVEMSLHEILCGNALHGFRGLIPMCLEFIETHAGVGPETKLRFAQYVGLILDRTAGRRLTCAQFLRKFVLTHPDYKQDSVISPTIAHDLTVLATNIGFGTWVAPDTHGEVATQLILQTPLPASTTLPQLSPSGVQVVQFQGEDDIISTLGHPKLLLQRKPVIALNAIDSIYTMPVGVTARFAGSSRRNVLEDPQHHSMDLFDMTLVELLRKSCQPCALKRTAISAPSLIADEPFAITADVSTAASSTESSPIHGAEVVSSEDFTQAWILKAENVGGQKIKYADGSGKRTPVSHLIGTARPTSRCTDQRCSKFCDMADQLCRPTGDIISTACPSSTSEACECEVDDDLMHELSRSLSLGFDTEQELEYFRQVCDASA